MIAEFPSLNNLAACLFMLFIFIGRHRALCLLLVSWLACLSKVVACII